MYQLNDFIFSVLGTQQSNELKAGNFLFFQGSKSLSMVQTGRGGILRIKFPYPKNWIHSTDLSLILNFFPKFLAKLKGGMVISPLIFNRTFVFPTVRFVGFLENKNHFQIVSYIWINSQKIYSKSSYCAVTEKTT